MVPDLAMVSARVYNEQSKWPLAFAKIEWYEISLLFLLVLPVTKSVSHVARPLFSGNTQRKKNQFGYCRIQRKEINQKHTNYCARQVMSLDSV